MIQEGIRRKGLAPNQDSFTFFEWLFTLGIKTLNKIFYHINTDKSISSQIGTLIFLTMEMLSLLESKYVCSK